jgi:hypothetical protein
MILSDLVEEVNSLIDHNPNITTHTNHIVRLLNRHYESVCSQHPWRFLQKRLGKTLLADVTGTAANTVSVVQGNNTVTAAGATAFDRVYEGMIFKGPDDIEMPITGVNNALNQMYLADNYAGASSPASASWSIIMNKVFFPKDMVDFLGVTTRSEFTNGASDRRLTYVDPRREEEYLLDWTTSGDVTMVLDREGTDVDIQNMVIILSLISSGSSDLVVGQTYEYCATLEYSGMESPPTKPVQIAPTTGNDTVRITFANPPGTHSIRHRKNIYRRNVTNNTSWERIATEDSVGSAASATTTHDDGGKPGDPAIHLYYQMPREVLQIYKKPATDTTIEIRYHKRPYRLTGDTDAPMIPPQYHMILVYLVLNDLYTQYGMGNLAQLYKARADEKLIDMQRKYLDRTDRVHRRRVFAGSGMGGGYRYGDPVKS